MAVWTLGCFSKFCRRLGFLDEKVTLLDVLDRAVERVNESAARETIISSTGISITTTLIL